jgi:hypothetical protein
VFACRVAVAATSTTASSLASRSPEHVRTLCRKLNDPEDFRYRGRSVPRRGHHALWEGNDVGPLLPGIPSGSAGIERKDRRSGFPSYAARPTPSKSTSTEHVTRSNPLGDSNPCSSPLSVSKGRNSNPGGRRFRDSKRGRATQMRHASGLAVPGDVPLGQDVDELEDVLGPGAAGPRAGATSARGEGWRGRPEPGLAGRPGRGRCRSR